jgi:phosphatidate cytidylyltransferase
MPAEPASAAAAPPAGAAGARPQWLVRTVSGLVLAPPALLMVYFGFPWVELLLAAAAALMAFEWARMTLTEARALSACLIAATAFGAIAAAASGHGRAALAIAAAGAVAAGVGARLARDPHCAWAAAGAAYIAVPCLAAAWLREATPAGRELMLWILPTIWASDVAAYAVGSTLDGPRLAPRISPKKTWAGAAGGVAGAALVGGVAGSWLGLGGGWSLAALGAAASVVGQLGDLLKSAVKRRFGVKDTGRLIPGHGGVLDRVDALLAAIPLVAALAWLKGGRLPAW